MTRHLRILIGGAALIVLSNAAALIGVAYNRSGEPDAVLELSERELTRPSNYYVAKENSGLALRLSWRVAGDSRPYLPGFSPGGRLPWLDKDKLTTLGFDLSADTHDSKTARRYRNTLPRKAYVVLEFDGPAYQAALQQTQGQLEEAKAKLATDPDNKASKMAVQIALRHLDDQRHKSSRLFAIDVGPDRDGLRSRYPDRRRYLILSGQVRILGMRDRISGYLSGLQVGSIHIPLADRAAITGGGGPRPEHYTVRLAFGKRGEPWILAAHAGEAPAPNTNGGSAN